MIGSMETDGACANAGELLENPVLLEKEANRVGELFSRKAEFPHGMNKGVRTAQEFGDILGNDSALAVDWGKLCEAGKEDF